MSPTRRTLHGPTRVPLAHQERIDRHHHLEHQLICPSRGVLEVSTPLGMWAVPPHRAVWIPAGAEHSHRAHGPTELRALTFGHLDNPLRLDRPTVLAVTPLLREVVACLTDDTELAGDQRQRRNLERVALDQLRRVEPLEVCLPAPADARLRDIARILRHDPADGRTLTELGKAVGSAPRTLSRLFRAETGMSFPQWRTQLRLHHALTLLASGGSVTTVAAACGYSGPSAFIQSFRHAFGTTPGSYAAGGS
ncbi:helix-turn-helix domain-containing protein [Streptomyces sp. RKAG290]|uniref:AraC family transcriptional regulator n=1 Tax=Streptomyces sp. RKAG290 TaxID=2888348 RepID=UPI002033CA52|nr:helix-turn-helix transcriptional regulator [Streptomyces sp. RKAG290]MCM2413059.1 helix-turn-helix transcriptional regulator [Streptomyces sp. RKAG290]